MHVVVIGAGFAGLLAAYRAVQAGNQVTIVEAQPQPGGAIAAAHLDLPEGRLTVDAGAEAFAARSTGLVNLVAELGLKDRLVTPAPHGSWLYLPEVGAVPAPKVGMWGIPAEPNAPEVVAALGEDGARRAAQEFSLPMDNWAKAQAAGETITVGQLVADRFGDTVLQRLVAPMIAGVHSADPYDVDVEKIAPGLLNRAIETGSVARAVAQIRAAAPPGAAVKTLTGGMHTLITALWQYLTAKATIRLNTAATAVDITHHTVITADGDTLTADRVVITTNAPAAYDLLAPHAGLTQRPRYGTGVALVMSVIDTEQLDNQPRGTGMLVAPTVQHVNAKAATHVTAKWDWAAKNAQAQHPHRHVLRLSYGRITDPADGSAPGYNSTDAQLLDYAANDVVTMFGLDPKTVAQHTMATKIQRWRNEMPVTTPDNVARIDAITKVADTTDWVDVVGAWTAGTGLAAITKHIESLQF